MSDAYQKEFFRNRFHFSPLKGWMNDINGLWFDGEKYHITYQHYPYAAHWDSMHWGHASSPDMFHWTHHDPVLVPSVNTKGMAMAQTTRAPST